MFTGLVEETVRLADRTDSSTGARLVAMRPTFSAEVRVGDSISVNGCCLTVSHQTEAGELVFDLLGETLQRTNLGAHQRGSVVNLERAVRADSRLGGHFVQGHIDCTSPIISFEPHGNDHRLEIALPREFARYVAFKGSIAVDGISLTIAEVGDASFVVWIIPHTAACTNLATRGAGDLVNLEFDLLAKYVERIINTR